MQERRPILKGVYILPNLFTTASLFTGFWAIILAANGRFEGSAWAILFSGLMDGLDGKVARLTNTTSEFGVQYDSLTDLVAFGVAPGFMAYAWQLKTFGRTGMAAAFLFAACAALRLARFNISTGVTPKKFFVGISTTASGAVLASFVLFQRYVPHFLEGAVPLSALLLTVCVALLMVSRVRYYAFKEFGAFTAHRYRYMVIAMLIFVVLMSAPKLWCFLLGFTYLLSGPVYSYIILPRRARAAQALQPEETRPPA